MNIRASASHRLWVDHPDTDSTTTTLVTALAIAGILHLAVLLTVGFKLPEPLSKRSNTRPLEVVVLRQAAPSETKPEMADALAQVDREGGGVEEVPEPQSEIAPEPIATPPAPPAIEPMEHSFTPPQFPEPFEVAHPPPAQAIEEPPLTATLEPEEDDAAPPDPPELELALEPEPELMPELEPIPAEVVTAAQIMASRSLEIAELTARIEQKSTAYSKRERRKAISASTKEYKYANYLEAWRRKVERIGNLNYPEEAKKHKLYGTLILHVAVRADGSIERVRVLRSSGFEILDQAAIRIVELAAPYSPFPPDIKADTDVLDITRTWQFLSNNRLGWDN